MKHVYALLIYAAAAVASTASAQAVQAGSSAGVSGGGRRPCMISR